MSQMQVGQCGNQLGQSLWQALDSQCTDTPSGQEASFFKLDAWGRRQARCLLIDTEPKVVRGLQQEGAISLRQEEGLEKEGCKRRDSDRCWIHKQ